MKKRYLALIVAGGIVGGYALGYAHTKREDVPTITPGIEFSGIADDSVAMLSFIGERMTFTAQRSTQGSQFAVQATFSDGRATQRCTASADLSGQLGLLSSYIAKRQVTFQERDKDFPIHLGNLIVQPLGEEPSNPMMVFTDKNRTSIAVIFDRYAAELTIPPAAFSRLETACLSIVAN